MAFATRKHEHPIKWQWFAALATAKREHPNAWQAIALASAEKAFGKTSEA
jgi:hypothetical protein